MKYCDSKMVSGTEAIVSLNVQKGTKTIYKSNVVVVINSTKFGGDPVKGQVTIDQGVIEWINEFIDKFVEKVAEIEGLDPPNY